MNYQQFHKLSIRRWKTNWKNMVPSFVSRNNQDGISRLNTAPQSAETMVTDRNSKQHPPNKVNQKELPQLNRNITVPSFKLEQSSEQKVRENQKAKSVNAEVI